MDTAVAMRSKNRAVSALNKSSRHVTNAVRQRIGRGGERLPRYENFACWHFSEDTDMVFDRLAFKP